MAPRPPQRDVDVVAVTAAGTGQSDAAAILAKWSPALITATGDGTVGVRLPPASKGRLYYIKNLAAGAVLKVWPASGDQINALGNDTSISMAAATSAVFIASGSAQWYTVPLLPS